MKKILFLSVFSLCGFSFALNPSLDSARSLAQDGIIVTPSSSQNTVSGFSEQTEMSLYRLNDTLIRQEALSIALKLRGVTIPDSYSCQGYFSDVREFWVCRAIELAADYGLVTRKNTKFRPYDSLTLAESLKILMGALEIPLSSNASSIPGSIPEWQKNIARTFRESNISFSLYDSNGRVTLSFSGSDSLSAPVTINMSHRVTRGEFFQLVTILQDFQSRIAGPTDHCTQYNDGCNDCSRTDNGVSICTKRACFWQGIPSCSACEYGYTLQDNRCVKAQTACITLGNTVSNYSLPPMYQTYGSCCSGLTSVGPKDAFIVGAPNICANIGDGYCDTRYESSLNSTDCRVNSCISEGGYAGGGYVMYPENINDFQCCSGLTRADRKDGNMIADGGNTCINQGDGYCDTRYESAYNSSDCRADTVIDTSICSSYYDGCNTCTTVGGNTACTMRYCFVNGPSYCTNYNAYTPVSRSIDDTFLGKVASDIRSYTRDVSCTSSSQCQWKMFGSNPCGSSSTAIPYSTKNIDEVLLAGKTNYYTSAQSLYNQTYGIMGNCMVMTSPAPLSCINGQCTSGY